LNTWSKFSLAFVAGLLFVACITEAQDSSQPADSSQTPNTSTSTSTLGMATEKPAEAPFVELPDGRFMVPYTAKIPGTDVEFRMTPIPAGKFTMGSPASEDDRRDDEGPQFEVDVKPFWMGQHEVTWAEYKKYMAMDSVFKALQRDKIRVVKPDNQIDAITAPSALYDPSFTYEAGEEPDQPAASMTQFAAKQYTKWLSLMSETFYRLPTEAEWEYACRAGTKTAYYFGDDPDELEDHAWCADNANEERHTVGEKKPNAWGLYDMHGNVSEWVLDQYDEAGYKHVEGDSATTEAAFNKPTKLYPRVVRGGSWELAAEDCRSASRLGSDDEEWKYEDPNFPKSPWWYTDTPGLGVGFRLFRPLEAPENREQKEAVWGPDLEEISDDSQNRIKSNGRGAYGTVDPNLPKDIENLSDDNQ
jgi:sulfatase modifying factor 1